MKLFSTCVFRLGGVRPGIFYKHTQIDFLREHRSGEHTSEIWMRMDDNWMTRDASREYFPGGELSPSKDFSEEEKQSSEIKKATLEKVEESWD